MDILEGTNMEKNENFDKDEDVLEHISDQLQRTAQLVRKSKLSRNNVRVI